MSVQRLSGAGPWTRVRAFSGRFEDLRQIFVSLCADFHHVPYSHQFEQFLHVGIAQPDTAVRRGAANRARPVRPVNPETLEAEAEPAGTDGVRNAWTDYFTRAVVSRIGDSRDDPEGSGGGRTLFRPDRGRVNLHDPSVFNQRQFASRNAHDDPAVRVSDPALSWARCFPFLGLRAACGGNHKNQYGCSDPSISEWLHRSSPFVFERDYCKPRATGSSLKIKDLRESDGLRSVSGQTRRVRKYTEVRSSTFRLALLLCRLKSELHATLQIGSEFRYGVQPSGCKLCRNPIAEVGSSALGCPCLCAG